MLLYDAIIVRDFDIWKIMQFIFLKYKKLKVASSTLGGGGGEACLRSVWNVRGGGITLSL